MITLRALAQTLDGSKLSQVEAAKAEEISLSGLDCDSRVVVPGHLFVCKGQAFKPTYLSAALEKGAVAYMCDATLSDALSSIAPNVPALVVPDIRDAMAVASPLCWTNPTEDGRVFALGITGTKGKSTTAIMLRSILLAEGRSAGIMGSIETDDGIEHFQSVNTTPESPDLWRHFANCAKSDTPYMVMEVSSQALKYQRVYGVNLEIACFLNIGKDHISPVEHPNFEDYFESKLKIFDQAKCAVINLDSDNMDTIIKRSKNVQRRLAFTCDPDVAEGYFGYCGEVKDLCLWASNIEGTDSGMNFCVHTPTWTDAFHIPMIGHFNVQNALAAITMAYDQGISKEAMQKGLAHVQVPGRMVVLPTLRSDIVGIIDYAHNKLSFENFFTSVREHFGARKIIAVFGAPGGKAFERRQELPEVASRYADHIIFTTEDPAHEKVEDILAELAHNTDARTPHETILDRQKATERAVDLATLSETGAVVCLLAKGEECYQHIGDEFVPSTPDAELFVQACKKLGL